MPHARPARPQTQGTGDQDRSPSRRQPAGNTTCSLALAVLLLSAGPLCAGQLFRAPELTSLIREWAKNKPRVLIVTSGPGLAAGAARLQQAILRHPSCPKSKVAADVPILTLDEAKGLASSDTKLDRSSLVILVDRHDVKGDLPTALGAAARLSLAGIDRHEAHVRAIQTHTPGEGLAFAVLAAGPDAESVDRLLETLGNRTTMSLRDLPFEAGFVVNKVAVFSAEEDRAVAETWGALTPAPRSSQGPARSPDRFAAGQRLGQRPTGLGIGSVALGPPRDVVQWHSLADRDAIPREQLADFTEAYLVNRSRGTPVLPEPVRQLQGASAANGTTIFVGKGMTDHEEPLAVICVPTTALLKACARAYPNVAAIPDAAVKKVPIDLTSVHKTALLVGGIPDGAVREAVRLTGAADMRDALAPVEVAVRGEGLEVLQDEVTLQDLLGRNPKIRQALSDKGGLQYVFLFAVSSIQGSTSYQHNEVQGGYTLRPYPIAYPAGKHKDAEQAEWQRRKAIWDEAERRSCVVPWDLFVYKTSSAEMRAVLHLVDMADGAGKVLWQTQVEARTETSREVLQSSTTTVRGVDNRPDSLPSPPSQESCSDELVKEAAREACRKGIEAVQLGAVFPGPSGTGLRATALQVRDTVATTAPARSATATLAATLTLVPGGPVGDGKPIAFSVGGRSAGSATTDASGSASVSYSVPADQPAGDLEITCRFAGDGQCAPCEGKGRLTVEGAGRPEISIAQHAYVAEVLPNGTVVVLKAAADLVAPGDSAYVLQPIEIKDAEGKVVATRYTALCKLRVTSVSDRTVDCQPIKGQPAGKVQRLMRVKWERAGGRRGG